MTAEYLATALMVLHNRLNVLGLALEQAADGRPEFESILDELDTTVTNLNFLSERLSKPGALRMGGTGTPGLLGSDPMEDDSPSDEIH